MGGSYSSSYESPCSSSRQSSTSSQERNMRQSLLSFAKTKKKKDLIEAYKAFSFLDEECFISELAEVLEIKTDSKGNPILPKEFSDLEYEIKFNITPTGRNKEPEVIDYLNAFDFPIGHNPRFIKDPVNNIATGINHFYGDMNDEKLVVIEKAGGIYLKEKGKVVPVKTGVPYENIVIKRKEERYQSDIEDVLKKVSEVTSNRNVKYRGKIRKEKGDVFVLDTNDGRVYSFTITRAHLIKPGEKEESAIQRQLEMEYAGYVPGFSGFESSEKQIVQGMVDLAKYTWSMYNGAPLGNNWTMGLNVTEERKYDFVAGLEKKVQNQNSALFHKSLELEYAK